MVITTPTLIMKVADKVYDEMLSESFEEFQKELAKSVMACEDESQLLGLLALTFGVDIKRITLMEDIKKLADLNDKS